MSNCNELCVYVRFDIFPLDIRVKVKCQGQRQRLRLNFEVRVKGQGQVMLHKECVAVSINICPS